MTLEAPIFLQGRARMAAPQKQRDLRDNPEFLAGDGLAPALCSLGLGGENSCETKPISDGWDTPPFQYPIIPPAQCDQLRETKPNLGSMGYLGEAGLGSRMIVQNEANSRIARRGQMGDAWHAPYKAGSITQNEANSEEAGQESGSIVQDEADMRQDRLGKEDALEYLMSGKPFTCSTRAGGDGGLIAVLGLTRALPARRLWSWTSFLPLAISA